MYIKGFSTMQEVIDIQNTVLKKITNQNGRQHTKNFLNSDDNLFKLILQKEIESLVVLEKEYRTKETAFFNRYGLSSFEHFKEKIKQWNNYNMGYMLKSESLINQIRQVFVNADYSKLYKVINKYNPEDLQEDIKTILSQALDKDDLSLPLLKILEQAGKILSIELKGKSNKGRKRRGTISITVENVEGIGEGYTKHKDDTIDQIPIGITFFRKKKSTKRKEKSDTGVEIHLTTNLPMPVQRDLTNKLMERLQKDHNIDTSQLGDTIKDINGKIKQVICKYFSSFLKLSPDDLPDFVQAILTIIQDYMIDSQEIASGRNTSVIRGMLGEIYWNAFFKFFNLKYAPVGMKKGFNINDPTNLPKEIPVDIALNGFGAQVKNYTEENGIVKFNKYFDREAGMVRPKTISVYNFLTGRSYMDMNKTETEEVFGKFWFSEYYNKTDYDEYPNSLKYVPIEQRFAPIHQGIETYFQASLRALLNLHKEVIMENTDAELLGANFEGGKPIFFIINKEIYPVSEMISVIKEYLSSHRAINGQGIIRMVDFSINLQPFSNIDVWYPDSHIEPNLKERLVNSNIRYIINVDVQALGEILGYRKGQGWKSIMHK